MTTSTQPLFLEANRNWWGPCGSPRVQVCLKRGLHTALCGCHLGMRLILLNSLVSQDTAIPDCVCVCVKSPNFKIFANNSIFQHFLGQRNPEPMICPRFGRVGAGFGLPGSPWLSHAHSQARQRELDGLSCRCFFTRIRNRDPPSTNRNKRRRALLGCGREGKWTD